MKIPNPVFVLAVLCPLFCQSALAETTYTPVDFGSVTIGQNNSAKQTLSFTFSGLSETPVFSFQFGVSFRSAKPVCNSDFTACTLATWFVPATPGVTRDAVVVKDSDENLLGRMVVSGKGSGPLLAFSPGISAAGLITGVFSTGGTVVDPAGSVYVSDLYNNVVRKTDAWGNYITVVAGISNAVGYSGDGDLGVNATLKTPMGLALDGAGNLFICDSGNAVIRRVDAVTGIISTVAGTGVSGFAGDGNAATSAQLNSPQSIAFDATGNLFVADSNNNRIRMVNMQSGVISTVAGTGTAGYSGDDGAAVSATLRNPSGLAFDSLGNLYIADTGNQIVRVVKAGIISRFAGVAGLSGSPIDGSPALTTAFSNVRSLAFDAADNLYILQTNSVPRISPLGLNPVSVLSTFYSIFSTFTLDSWGNLYLIGEPSQLISHVAAPVSFSSAHVGLTSSYSERLANVGNQDLAISSFAFSGTAASDFQQTNDCGSVLGPGANCNIRLTFRPSAMGLRSASLIIKDNASGSSQTIPLSGMGLSPGMATVSAAMLTFGTQAIGTRSASQTVTLSNPGTGPLNINSISSSSAFPMTHNCGVTLAAGASCTISVSFAPVAEYSNYGTLTISTDASEGTRFVNLSGTILYTYSFVASSDTLSFGSRALGSTPALSAIGLTNTGTASLSIQTRLTGQDASNFSLGSFSTCSYLPRNSTCQVSVSFIPNARGPRRAQLIISSTPGSGSYTIDLFGYTSGPIDYDQDGHRDYAVWRPDSGSWLIAPSSNPFAIMSQQWGWWGDVPMPGDYDGDGLTDYAVWRPSDGDWYVVLGKDPSQVISRQWGSYGDVPVKGDFDGDGKLDYAVWRPSNGTWYVIKSARGEVVVQQWGMAGDIPIAADFDGDGKADFAVWRPSEGNWYVIRSSLPSIPVAQQWGAAGDIPVAGDYDGDGRADFAVWRPSNGTWYIKNGLNGAVTVQQWGAVDDIPLPEDHDGDGKTDMSVWRPSVGNWYTILSSRPATPVVRQWGLVNDVPL